VSATLLTAGLACVICAIVGGGLKAWGIELPALESGKRQFVLGLFGMVLIASSIASQDSSLSKTAPKTEPETSIPKVSKSNEPAPELPKPVEKEPEPAQPKSVEKEPEPPKPFSRIEPVTPTAYASSLITDGYDFEVRDGIDFTKSTVSISIPDANLSASTYMDKLFEEQSLRLTPGLHVMNFQSRLVFKSDQEALVTSCRATLSSTSQKKIYLWGIKLDKKMGLVSCSVQ
jgi:hypothetical protein